MARTKAPKNTKEYENKGEDFGKYTGGSLYGPVGYWGGKEIGGMAGGLFDDEDPGYGRYYTPISTNDPDYEEDVQENRGMLPYWNQNLKDRWGFQQGSAERGEDKNPLLARPAYRRAVSYTHLRAHET